MPFQKASRRSHHFLVAAPSCVIPAPIEDNCRYLAPLVDEVGLCFFETASCLRYTATDLPGSLTDLGLGYHVHLPLDLDWSRGGGAAARACLRLADLAAHLAPRCFVLHPPDSPETLREFVRIWQDGGMDPAALHLENIRSNDLSGLMETIHELGCLICLDTGHVLAYAQDMLSSPLPRGTNMLHLYASGADGSGGHGHASLAEATGPDRDTLRTIATDFVRLAALPRETGLPTPCIMLELFHPERLAGSLEVLDLWLADAEGNDS